LKSIRKQRGVALFVALLVVTIATLLATEMWFRNSLDIARQFNSRSVYQASYYSKGMLLWARDILRQDYEQEAGFDSRNEGWNQPIAGIELPDAMLSGKLIDFDSKFNLNNLVIKGQVNALSIDYFKRVLLNLEMDVGLADKIIDWLDANQIPSPQGAEDSIYLSKSPSYRSAGQPFAHISELRLVDGIDKRSYQRLIAYVTVLPVQGTQATTMNVNTMPTLLLKSLDVTISTKDALILFSDGSASYKTLRDFFKQPAIQYLGLDDDVKQLDKLISTKSNWFQARVDVRMDESLFTQYAILYRPNSLASIKQLSDTSFIP
jgi:general secretion pathway protein K